MLHLYHALGLSGHVPHGGQAGMEGLCASHQGWEQDGTALPCLPDGLGWIWGYSKTNTCTSSQTLASSAQR